MPFYGRETDTYEGHWGYFGSGLMRGAVFNQTTANIWVINIGAFAARYLTGNATIKGSIYETNTSKDPTNRLGYSNTTVVTNYSGDGSSNLAVHEMTIAHSDDGPSDASIPLGSGKRFGIFIDTTGGDISHGQAAVTADNENFYQRSRTSPPPDPIGSYSKTFQSQHPNFWAEYITNVDPDAPSSLSPSGIITDTAPTFSGNFTDTNAGDNGGTDVGDIMTAVSIKVRRKSDAVSFWNLVSSPATTAEKAADAFSRAYGGTTLVRGTEYEWQSQVEDWFGHKSAWTAWTSFTPAALGTVTLDGNPTGYEDDNTPDFEGRWTHETSAAMTQAKLRLYSSGGSLISESSAFSKAVSSSAAPGTLFTVTWAESEIATALTWGATYKYSIAGYDGTAWSDWSAQRSFTVNPTPSIPSGLSHSGALVSIRPLLTATVTDLNDSDPDLEAYCVIESKENIANPTFETDASSWGEDYKDTGFTYVASRDASVYSDAAGALKLAISAIPGTAGLKLRYVSTDYVPIVPGRPYSYKAKVRMNDAGVVKVRMVGIETNATPTEQDRDVSSDAPNTADAWHEVYLSGVAATGATRLYIGVEVENILTTGATDVWIDAIEPDGFTARGVHQATLQSGNVFGYQTTSAADSLPDYGEYRHKWFSYDGFVYSGGAATAETATLSGTATFTYALGPDFDIDTPLDLATITDPSFDIDITINSGGPKAKHRVEMVNQSTGITDYDSGLVASTGTTITVPSGSYRNNATYALTVTVENDSTLQSTQSITIDIAYTPPPSVSNATALAIAVGTDPFPTAILCSWDESSEVGFDHYRVRRMCETGPDAGMDETVQLSSASSISSVFYIPASGHTYTFEVSQVTLVAGEYVESDPVQLSASVDLEGLVLCDVRTIDTAESNRAILMYGTDTGGFTQFDEYLFRPVGGRTPRSIRGQGNFDVYQGVYDTVDDSVRTAIQRFDELKALHRQNKATICLRNERGEKIIGTITSVKWRNIRTRRNSIDLTFGERDYEVTI